MTKAISLSHLTFLLLLVSQPLHAAIITVNTTEDKTNSLDTKLSLREAVLKAKAGDTVRFSPLLSGETIEVEKGAILVNGTVSIDAGSLFSPPTISRSGFVSDSRLFEVTGQLNLDGLILVGGRSSEGGAIRCVDGTLELVNCVFAGNSAGSGKGGAVYCSNSEVTLINCVFSGNLAGRGGGLACDDSNCSMTNCTISGNRASFNNGGGGVYLVRTGSNLSNSIMWDNRAGIGSSEANHSYASVSSLELHSNLLISGREVSGVDGLDGTDPDNDPHFKTPVDPDSAPTTAGSLQPRLDSLTVNTGNDARISLANDVAGGDRKVGRVDLGAYEFQREIIYVDANGPTAGDDGSSWATAFNFLSDGLAVASSGNSIFIAEGMHFPDEGTWRTDGNRDYRFDLQDEVNLHGGFPTGGGRRDIAANVTVLSGDIDQDDEDADGNGITESHTQVVGGNSFRVIDVDSVSGIVVEGLTICGGRGDEFERLSGANAAVISSELTFIDCRFLGGYTYAVATGGGISGSGGGMRITRSDVGLERCQFSGNLSLFGGGIWMQSSSVSLISCYFFENEGIALESAYAGSVLEMTNCVLAGNTGGAISLSRTAATVTNCTISGNTGGAIGMVSDSSCSLINSIIWMNDHNGETNTARASIFDPDGGMSYSFSLVENIDLSGIGNGNLDGTDPRNVPAFVDPIDPATAPSNDADLSLARRSPGSGAGDIDANSTAVDVRGLPRTTSGRIDLGAYEQGEARALDVDLDCLPDFWERHYSPENSATAMDAMADTDGDGLANFEEFYFGLNPHKANAQADYMEIKIIASLFEGEPQLLLEWREWGPAVAYVTPFPEKSSDLRVWSRGGMHFSGINRRSGYNNMVLTEPISAANPRGFMKVVLFRRCGLLIGF